MSIQSIGLPTTTTKAIEPASTAATSPTTVARSAISTRRCEVGTRLPASAAAAPIASDNSEVKATARPAPRSSSSAELSGASALPAW